MRRASNLHPSHLHARSPAHLSQSLFSLCSATSWAIARIQHAVTGHAAHPRRCSSSSYPLLLGLVVSFPQEPLQGETLSGNWDHKTSFSSLSQPPVFMCPKSADVPRSPSKRCSRTPLWAGGCWPSALPGLRGMLQPAENLSLASARWKHFLKAFGKAGRLWGGLADVACEQSAVQCGYVYWGELRDNGSSSCSEK